MNTGRRCLATLLLSLATVSSASVAAPLATPREMEEAGFRLHWEATLPLTEGDSVVAGYLLDNALYVVTDFSRLFAVTADSGLIRWAHDVTDADYRVFPPSHMVTQDGTGPVVVPTATATHVYDRFSGRLLQRYTPRHTNAGPVVAGENVVVTGGVASRVSATRIGVGGDLGTLMLWEVATDAPVTARPLLVDGQDVLFASRGGTVYRCGGVDKKLRYATHVGGSIEGDPAVDATGVYVSSIDRSVYKVDLQSGRRLWRVRFQEPLTTGPILARHLVFQNSDRDGLTAMEPDSGAIRWRRPDSKQFVADTKAGVVFWTRDNNLVVVDPETGEAVTGVATSHVGTVVQNTQSDTVFLLGKAGTINALRLGDVPYLKRQQILSARRTLNQKPVAASGTTEPPVTTTDDARHRVDDPLRSKRDIQR